jgi:dipeptidyl aminopeptidase/acylaminoacyl peptidase
MMKGHGFRKKENQINGYRRIKDFLDDYLKTPPTLEPSKSLLD